MNNTITLGGITYKIIKTESYKHNGKDRKSFSIAKMNGKKVFNVIQYENGEFSSVVG